MAVSKTRTLLPLDTFARIAGIHPLHFNQVAVPDVAPEAPSGQCDSLLCQYSWQMADKTGREEIAQAIADAEDLLATYLGYPIAPKWIEGETALSPRPANPALYNTAGLDVRGQFQSLRLNNGFVHYGGQEAKSLIAANRAIAYTDTDGDNYKDQASVTVNTSVTDPEEICAFYPGQNGDFSWQIRPVKVSIAAGVATIIFQRAQCVLPELLEALDPSGINGLDDNNFLSGVDIYRVYNDPSVQVQFIWDANTLCPDCGQNECAACGLTIQSGCLTVRDSRLGMVAPAPGSWNGSSFDFAYYTACRASDRLRVWYRAGWLSGSSFLTIDPMWARAVTYLALSMLDRPLCSCEALQAFTAHWSDDMAIARSSPAGGTSVNLGRKVNNPIGTTRAALYAWALVQRHALGEAA